MPPCRRRPRPNPLSTSTSTSCFRTSSRHARAILGLPDEPLQLRVGRDVVERGLSVRETETLVKRTIDPPPPKPEAPKDVHTRAAEERLRFALGTRVRIV